MVSGFGIYKIVVIICLMTKASAVRVGAFRTMGKGGVTFQDGLVFEDLARSKVQCAQLCSRRDDCVHFTWTDSSPGALRSVCRGHSTFLDESRFTTEMGAKTYTLAGQGADTVTWVNQTCTANSQCPAAKSECYSGRCLCTPGYYYSNSQKTCSATCQESSLQPIFLKYPGGAIDGYNTFCFYTNRDQCLGKCRSESNCRTLDFGYQEGDCCGHEVTPLQAHLSNGPSDVGYDFYQKTCA